MAATRLAFLGILIALLALLALDRDAPPPRIEEPDPVPANETCESHREGMWVDSVPVRSRSAMAPAGRWFRNEYGDRFPNANDIALVDGPIDEERMQQVSFCRSCRETKDTYFTRFFVDFD